jgi:hypothetical protein
MMDKSLKSKGLVLHMFVFHIHFSCEVCYEKRRRYF